MKASQTQPAARRTTNAPGPGLRKLRETMRALEAAQRARLGERLQLVAVAERLDRLACACRSNVAVPPAWAPRLEDEARVLRRVADDLEAKQLPGSTPRPPGRGV